MNDLGGQNKIRIRLRGIGSGFKEGTLQQELQEPMHFNISAENEELLRVAVDKIQNYITNTRNDYNI